MGALRKPLILLTAAAALTACGGDSTATEAAAESSTAPATTTVTETVQPEDVAGRSNCVQARLAYGPISAGLGGATDLEDAVEVFRAPDVDPATSDAGQAAAVAIAEMNFELALAAADVLTGQPVDEARLSELLDAVDAACAAVG